MLYEPRDVALAGLALALEHPALAALLPLVAAAAAWLSIRTLARYLKHSR